MEVLNKEKVLAYAKKLIGEGKIDRAIVEYNRLLEIDPKDMRVKIRIAELLARQKKMSEAIKAYKEVADSYTEDGFYLKAVTVYKNVLRLNPSLVDINFCLAELYEKMGLAKDAVHQYQILANSLEQKGDYERLIEVRAKMVEIDPHNVAGRIRLAETYQYQGREEEALAEYEKLVEEVKKSGKADQLVELYEKILSYRSDDINTLRLLVEICFKRGEWKRVVSHLEKKGDLIEAEPEVIVMEAASYAQLNQLDTARRRYKLASSVFIERGDIESALECYREILVIFPSDEEEVREMVAEIDADYFDKLKTEAEEKRQRIEEKALAKAEEDSLEDEVSPSSGSKAAVISENEAGARLRSADAAFELGKAYQQMGLASEAAPELEKCLDIYRELVTSGYGSDEINSRIATIEGWLGLEEMAHLKKEPVVESAKKVEAAEVKKTDKEPEEEKKDKKKGKKKKDKRVGFV